LAIAAIAALGGAGDEVFESSIQPLLSEPTSAFCLNFAKLNLFQCLAGSKPYYEDVFCLGKHAVIDLGMCVMQAAGSPNPAWVEPPPIIPQPKAKPKSKSSGKGKGKPTAARPAASKPKGK
jgi:hypothetical protein